MLNDVERFKNYLISCNVMIIFFPLYFVFYNRKVMIKSKADNLLPKWLRFVKGVVDSEDIPLNLSRELLQDSALIRKLRHVLTNRILRFLQEEMKLDFL